MKKKLFVLVFFILVVGNVFAQKLIEREFDASEITAIEINSAIIYQIKVTSEKTNTIKVRTQIEGENYENVVLSILENKNTLQINTPFTPFFEAKNDKLAAHKLISIEVELIIPEHMAIKIIAEIASVEIIGTYKDVSVLLENGNCILTNFKGNAMLKTKQGFITVYASKETLGTAFSKKGAVINKLSETNVKATKYRIEAESFKGNITLFQFH